MTDETSMWDDPQESSALRQLLRAGQVENSDYDVERGLARHLAQLQAGTPLPAWAVQTTLQKSASWSILAWLLPPVISAGVVGAWLAVRPADPPPISLVPAVPPAAAAPVSGSSSNAASVAPVAVQDPAVNAAAVVPSVAAESSGRESHEARENNEHHAVLARSGRAPVRVVSTRRGRASRPDLDEAASYSAAQTTRDGRDANSTGAALATNKAASDDEAQKPAAAAAQEPAPAAAEEAKAGKAERRSKEDESNAKVDEVSGARLEREMRMLAVAQRVLAEDPARSLRLCRQGESEFSGSMFSAERKQVALLALVQLGKVDQARREGIPFLRAYPNAPWSARLRVALSTGRVPNP